MRGTISVLLLLIVAPALLTGRTEETISLGGSWKFLPGDDLARARTDFDDTHWKTLRVDRIWEEQEYDQLDGYAWYRFRVVIPSRLKEHAYLKDSLEFYLGKINNFDQCFLNGTIFGVNARTVPAGAPVDTAFLKADIGMWNVERRYVLAADDPRILWDRENVIAVRVFDQGGQGGMWSGDQLLKMVSIDEYLALDTRSHPFAFRGNGIEKKLAIHNTSSTLALKGVLSIEGKDAEGKPVLRRRKRMTLKPRGEESIPLRIPRLDRSAAIEYRFRFDGTSAEFIAREGTPYLLTPKPPRAPRINGAPVFGCRPDRPFLFAIPATGERPMQFSVEPLPQGLSLDPSTGIVTGVVKRAGEYAVVATAKNRFGSASRELRFVIGEKIALTPPMGWNSWNCWGLSVDAEKVLAGARAFKEKGLADHGWTYVNIDDGWEIKGDSPEPKRDTAGNIRTNGKFPDMKALGDAIHALGLKFGIYSSPGPLTCGGYTASWEHEQQDARSFASWGIDYLKYDWCSYDKIAKDTSRAELMKPYRVMREALDRVDRDILYSLCQYGMGKVWEWGASVGGNAWRTTGDITDTWESMSGIGFGQVENAPFAGPGHWNDPDMLVVGRVGWGPNLHPTNLTPDEQYTHISLWCLLSAPLLIGCDLAAMDDFTLNLLTNDEVLALDQDPLGKTAVPILKEGDVQVWVKDLRGGGKAVGMFNLGKNPVRYRLDLAKIGLAGSASLRDLWRRKDLGKFTQTFETLVPPHGVRLIKNL